MSKVPAFQLTAYSDGTYDLIDKDSVVDKHPASGEQTVNGEPVSQMSETALMILGLTSTKPQPVDHNTQGDTLKSTSYNTGGETQIGPDQGQQLVTNCTGNSDFNLGKFPAGVQRTVSLVAHGAGDCTGSFQLVDRTGKALGATYTGTDPSLSFTSGPNNTGLPVADPNLDVLIHVKLAKPLAAMLVNIT